MALALGSKYDTSTLENPRDISPRSRQRSRFKDTLGVVAFHKGRKTDTVSGMEKILVWIHMTSRGCIYSFCKGGKQVLRSEAT